MSDFLAKIFVQKVAKMMAECDLLNLDISF